MLRSIPWWWGGAMRPGEEKMAGVMCGIDAVGYQAREGGARDRERPSQILEWLAEVVNPTGKVGLIGVYFPEDPGGVDAAAKAGVYPVPLGKLWEKGIEVGMGQCPVKRYNAFLRDLITAGRAHPSFRVPR